jgi:hypothetical protein
MEDLLSDRSLSTRDIEKIYESLYIRAITYFEGFIENLFLGMLTKRITPSVRDVILRVEFRSDAIARDLAFGGKNYIDWFPYDKTEKIAGLFFRGGRPFSKLDKVDKNDIENMMVIRNVIAHHSSYSHHRFEEEVITSSLPLMPREKTPAGFLRSQFRVAPIQTRFELYQIKIASIARKIAG